MPIIPPPPVAPYVAPDLHPIAARGFANLVIVRNGKTHRVITRSFSHGLWIAAENAPLDVRFHRGDDGTVWAEQLFYVGGDRDNGSPAAYATAFHQTLDPSVVGTPIGKLRGAIRYEILTKAGRSVRTWELPMCMPNDEVRLDRADSPASPTFPGSFYDSCYNEEDVYTLGRLVGLDRGWAMSAPSTSAKVDTLRSGDYQLRLTVDPSGLFVDSDASNNSSTVILHVKQKVVMPRGRGTVPAPPRCISTPTGVTCTTPATAGKSSTSTGTFTTHVVKPAGTGRVRSMHLKLAGAMRHVHADGTIGVHRAAGDPPRYEAGWISTSLKQLEERVAHAQAVAEAGPQPRTGSPTPPPANVDLPNLRNSPSYGITTDEQYVRHRGVRDLLTFGALTWNAGPGRLEVEAFRESGTTLGAYQVFFKDGERTTRQARGTLIWHAAPGHNHFHFQTFARYRLLNMDGDVLRDSGKNSWCIVDTNVVDTTVPGVPGPDALDQRGLAGGCGTEPGSLWARLGLTVGAGDLYTQWVAGQAFDITTLPNGTYQIEITANPESIIAEADYTDNTSLRTVVIKGRKGSRIAVPRAHPLINGKLEREEFGK